MNIINIEELNENIQKRGEIKTVVCNLNINSIDYNVAIIFNKLLNIKRPSIVSYKQIKNYDFKSIFILIGDNPNLQKLFLKKDVFIASNKLRKKLSGKIDDIYIGKVGIWDFDHTLYNGNLHLDIIYMQKILVNYLGFRIFMKNRYTYRLSIIFCTFISYLRSINNYSQENFIDKCTKRVSYKLENKVMYTLKDRINKNSNKKQAEIIVTACPDFIIRRFIKLNKIPITIFSTETFAGFIVRNLYSNKQKLVYDIIKDHCININYVYSDSEKDKDDSSEFFLIKTLL